VHSSLSGPRPRRGGTLVTSPSGDRWWRQHRGRGHVPIRPRRRQGAGPAGWSRSGDVTISRRARWAADHARGRVERVGDRRPRLAHCSGCPLRVCPRARL